ncbi:hypothetical protein B7463_g11873, partial [Scytalidium lignicola]
MAVKSHIAPAIAAVLLLSVRGAAAHGQHTNNLPEGQYMSEDPIDSILWTHILLMMLSFGIIFPAGMVLGIVRNRWHVPVQVLGTVISIVAYFLGHLHKGRAFKHNIHGSFANVLMLMLVVQVVFGIYLKFHITKGFHGKIRKVAVVGHGIVGKLMPIVSWIQILFGGITALGFCHDDHLGQCLAHFIMGSAFIAYGILLTIVLLVGQVWLRRTGRSQEFFDSVVIAAWGCVNTFTEHRWGGPWVANDIQHTTMGVIWWSAGLAGIWLSRKRDGSPKRNFVPAAVLILTGWGMSGHPQHLMISTMVHTIFGYTLMAAGFTRIIEITFVLKDQNTLSDEGDANSFQYIPPFLLYAAGFLFMGATEQQMQMMTDAGISHVSYILVIYSFAFLMFLLTNMLIHLYAVNTAPPVPAKDIERPPRLPRANGHSRATDSTQIRDAEEFELAGLMSDEESPESPSTLGRNNQARVE